MKRVNAISKRVSGQKVKRVRLRNAALLVLVSLIVCSPVPAQKKKKTPKPQTQPVTELTKLREDYIKATKDYKASLEKLLAIYESNVTSAEAKLVTAKKLFDEGLISKSKLEEDERAVGTEKDKVAETRRQMTNADTQIADVIVEAQADEQLAKNLRLARNSLVRTTSFIRYQGTDGWGITDA